MKIDIYGSRVGQAMILRIASVVLLALLVAWPVLAQVDDVVIVAGEKIYHATVCSRTASLNPSFLRTIKKDALGAEFAPCPICKPDRQGEAAVAAPEAMERDLEELWSRYDASEIVTIIVGPRTTGLYHRRGCHWQNGGERQPFSRKEADARYFQPHQECMRRPPDTFTAEAEEALRRGQPTPVRALIGGTPTTSGTATTRTTPGTTPAPVRSTARQQCAATTKKGAQCSRLADVGSSYCWQHK